MSLLNENILTELLKKSMDLSFQARYQNKTDEEWIKDAKLVLEEVPTLVVLLACYRDRERILGLDPKIDA